MKLDLKIDGTSISQFVNTKYLGVIIKETVTWNDHLKTIYSMVSKSLSIFRKDSVNHPKDLMFTVHYILIHLCSD